MKFETGIAVKKKGQTLNPTRRLLTRFFLFFRFFVELEAFTVRAVEDTAMSLFTTASFSGIILSRLGRWVVFVAGMVYVLFVVLPTPVRVLARISVRFYCVASVA